MTVDNPPYAMQGLDHDADLFRQMLRALLGGPPEDVPAGVGTTRMLGAHGVSGPTAMKVTANGTPNMTVKVAPGGAFVTGTEAAGQGTYYANSQSIETLTIATANATNPRRDIIVAKVEDSDYGGSTQEWSLAVVQGTAAASPADPSLPANALALARVTVGAGATSITNGDITDLRTRAAALGGRIIAPSTNVPTTNLAEGLEAFLPDVDRIQSALDSSTWGTTAHLGAWTTYTPTLTSSGGGLNVGSTATQLGRWMRLGRLILGTVAITAGGAGIASGSGEMRLPIPVAYRADDTQVLGVASFRNGAGSAWVQGQLTQVSGDALSVRMLVPQSVSTVAGQGGGSLDSGAQLRGLFLYEAAATG